MRQPGRGYDVRIVLSDIQHRLGSGPLHVYDLYYCSRMPPWLDMYGALDVASAVLDIALDLNRIMSS